MKLKPHRRSFSAKLALLAELFFDATMLLLFVVQAFLASCLLFYDYLPVPRNLGDALIASRLPEGLEATVQGYHLKLSGKIELVGLEIRAAHIQQPLFSAKSAELEFSLWNESKEFEPRPEALILSNGTLYTPSIYSPSGFHSPLLDHIAFRLNLSGPAPRIDRFAALHENVRLRGSLTLPTSQEPGGPAQSIEQSLNHFYQQAALLAKYRSEIHYFETPTILFTLKAKSSGARIIEARVSSQHYESPHAQAEHVLLEGKFSLQDRSLQPLTALRVQTARLQIPRYQIDAQALSAEIPIDGWREVIHGELPKVDVAASEIQVQRFTIDAPILFIDPTAYPQVQFRGATRGLNGAIELTGSMNAERLSGAVTARGSVDLLNIAPPEFKEKLPAIHFAQDPYFDLEIDFNEGLELDQARLFAQVDDLEVKSLHFDHIIANASYSDGAFAIDDLYLRRDWQWLDLKFNLNNISKDYRLTLIGSAAPNDYSPILPRWWEAIFKDFDFSEVKDGLGDFIIYGNTQRRAADLYFGHAQAKKVRYRDVYLDEGDLIVRGRGSHAQIHDLRVRSGEGWARGDIAFSSRLDEIKAPLSLRLDMEAKLTLSDAQKLFQGTVANIIAEFETEGLPITKLEGAIFNKAYPEYAGKSYFDLEAQLDQAVSYKGIPLDRLDFDLYGRSQVTHLRDIHFGYADGQGQAQIDVLTPQDGEAQLHYILSLQDADVKQALQGLPQIDPFGDSLEAPDAPPTKPNEREEARLNLNLEGQGPTADPFQHTGTGDFSMLSEKLGTIQLLGPLSKFLQNTTLSFTSFSLNKMTGTFSYEKDLVDFESLQIDGPRTQIKAPGTLGLKDQSLKMQVSVSLFGNAGNPDSNLRKISDLITSPIPNLLRFELTGTVEDQTLRSLYDPRNLIPRF